MRVEIVVPAIGESITEVTIGALLEKSGTEVRQDQEICELESEKVNQALVAPKSGKLSWNVTEGQVVAIGAVIGEIEASAAAAPEPKQPAAVSPPPAAPTEPAQIVEPVHIEDASDTVFEIIREQPAPAIQQELPPAVEPPDIKETTGAAEERRPMSRLRTTIAKRLVDTQNTTASLTTFNEADLSKIMEMRSKYKQSFAEQHGVGLGFMSFFIKATVMALKVFPAFNAYLDADAVVYRKTYDLSIAVATDKGLVVPVIKDCDAKSFAELESQLADMAQRARSGRLSLSEMQGGGFTITNAGVFGSLLSTPILNAPQVGILGMHRIMPRPVAVEGKVEIRPMMYLALTYDHRLIDGREAVKFLVMIKDFVEEPDRLLLDL